jgi:N-acetylglucosaminyldiphosphoundecaprenol N-acetyl-beta-D-mannosaminyltransferase
MNLVIGSRIDLVSYAQAIEIILNWSTRRESRIIFAANVHMIMEAYDSAEFRKIVNLADLVTPDGMPLVWLMRLKGQKNQERVYGPTLMLHVLEAASNLNIPVGFYGGKPEVLNILVQNMQERFKGLNVAYSFSPSFTENIVEQKLAIEEIKKSNARILFVGLGCPKQEFWMAKNRDKLNVVMLGVGAAFDFHAGAKPQAPLWMQNNGLEWLYRLVTEPSRLWRRYLYHNPRFLILAIMDLLGFFR